MYLLSFPFGLIFLSYFKNFIFVKNEDSKNRRQFVQRTSGTSIITEGRDGKVIRGGNIRRGYLYEREICFGAIPGDGKATLAKCAELLSTDLWEMIEKIRKLDYHLDYGLEELKEDISQ